VSRSAAGNTLAAALAVAISVVAAAPDDARARAIAVWWGQRAPHRVPADGAPGIRDARGHVVVPRAFRRIVAGSTVADRLLMELCENDRIVAMTAYGARHTRGGHQYAGKTLVAGLDDIEGLLALRPDLLLINNYGDPGRVARMREAGIEVFDLGEMRGLSTLLSNIEQVGALVGDPERAAAFSRSLRARLERVAAPLTATARRRGLYVSVYGNRLFGGTAGTNFHDVLTYGGLTDIAASNGYRDWPAYSAEALLALDPAVILTKPGMAERLCRFPGIERLQACGATGQIVEIESALLDDPGPAMLDAAEAVYEAVY